jgi:ribosomal protein S27E
MIGMCGNCRQDEILVMFTGGHAKRDVDCPVCGCYNVVTCYRLATEEEIPVA